ncbi:MAG: hypothetical protein EPO21_06405 [Chloroflexota bacterium]|nr:MAG: hypothetical protein EPO21_06405 [Chloroflexota bacterium]
MQRDSYSTYLPLLDGNPTDEAITNPSEWLSSLRSSTNISMDTIPECCVISFFRHAGARLGEWYQDVKEQLWPDPMFRAITFTAHGQRCGYLFPGYGAPIASLLLEQLIALGVRRFGVIGTAGTLRPELPYGSLLIPRWAIRDEGISYHYLPPSDVVQVTSSLSDRVLAVLRQRGLTVHEGGTWTTDAIYRETRRKVEAFRERGCASVEMELASLLAIAAFREIELAALFYLTDSVGGTRWDSRRDGKPDELIREETSNLVTVVVEALASTEIS